MYDRTGAIAIGHDDGRAAAGRGDGLVAAGTAAGDRGALRGGEDLAGGLRAGGVVSGERGGVGAGSGVRPGWLEPGGVELPRLAGGGGRLGGCVPWNCGEPGTGCSGAD
jgi:hypothetical protein